MKLADLIIGPEWIMWGAFGVLLLLAIVLISGQGSGLIAGYNTASKEKNQNIMRRSYVEQ
ncbi:DUF3784 domain-containing protein [Roseburia sp. 499]|uniref:DUF3784 domain-containing protein n=1 Tax=Roseburia sp. 499 TaxID=1261634 RepID=UPI00095167DE|nr:DUF3784 domain-containing protein [Roseburia sp. 499]WVK69623.1 DUF3784 domain-containing protein [Roseburia sp. 499]